MARDKAVEPAAPEAAPKLTTEQIETAVLLLLEGKWNGLAHRLARPEQTQASRERVARALKAEEIRQLEAPLNRARERQR